MTKKTNGEQVTPEDIKKILTYVEAHRDSSEPFEVAFADETSSDPEDSGKIVRPYAEAGVTWWLEGIWGSLNEMRKRIRSGPPRI